MSLDVSFHISQVFLRLLNLFSSHDGWTSWYHLVHRYPTLRENGTRSSWEVNLPIGYCILNSIEKNKTTNKRVMYIHTTHSYILTQSKPFANLLQPSGLTRQSRTLISINFLLVWTYQLASSQT